MPTEVVLLKLGQTMEKGAIVDWLKREGDPVRRGEVLFTVESDKAVLEVEAAASGFLRRILVVAGETVPVLSVVGLISNTIDEPLPELQVTGSQVTGSQTHQAGALVESGEIRSATGQASASELSALEDATRDVVGGRIFASPRARKTAREKGVSLAMVPGTGPGGRIVEQDVSDHLVARPKATPVASRLGEALGVDLAAVAGSGAGGRITKADVQGAAQLASPALAASSGQAVVRASVERVPLSGLRRAIADRMAVSVHTAARVTLVTEVDATAFVEAREKLKLAVAEEWGFSPGYSDLLALIVARALHKFSYMNARLSADGQAIERLPRVNLGMAVDTDRGLLVPVILDADRKDLRALGSEFRSLVARARTGKALPDDLAGGTFTITNLGMYDVDAFTPVINLPETAILGAGRIKPKPVVCDGNIVVRQMWTLSLAFDHRLVDGAPVARFLQWIAKLIENPYLLLAWQVV